MPKRDPAVDAPRMTRSLDCLGLRCPLPALKTRKALRGLAAGETLEVLSDDPLAGVDIPNVAREAGGELLVAERRDLGMRFLIRRSGEG